MQKTNNLQELFLTQARKQKIPVTMFLVNGGSSRPNTTPCISGWISSTGRISATALIAGWISWWSRGCWRR